ncbi:class I SAM-dependent methyltransferase [Methanoculleus taiwanensis]|uniref:class I SAM-dependent methyltransferase n=1 Tax=Methanoculleus taiwanensis TaxID=1550565 RepID=UPI0013E8E259|nr:methyltransferase domain-containing protein [Methanoculleus taiwanensis]
MRPPYQICPGMTVLDAGCGSGGEVTAIDMQEAMLHEAERQARRAGLTNVRFSA